MTTSHWKYGLLAALMLAGCGRAPLATSVLSTRQGEVTRAAATATAWTVTAATHSLGRSFTLEVALENAQGDKHVVKVVSEYWSPRAGSMVTLYLDGQAAYEKQAVYRMLLAAHAAPGVDAAIVADVKSYFKPAAPGFDPTISQVARTGDAQQGVVTVREIHAPGGTDFTLKLAYQQDAAGYALEVFFNDHKVDGILSTYGAWLQDDKQQKGVDPEIVRFAIDLLLHGHAKA